MIILHYNSLIKLSCSNIIDFKELYGEGRGTTISLHKFATSWFLRHDDSFVARLCFSSVINRTRPQSNTDLYSTGTFE